MSKLFLIIGAAIFLIGIYHQSLIKRHIKPDIKYSLFERFWYARMPPYNDLTERGKEYAKRAYFYEGVGFAIVVLSLAINQM